MAEEDAFQDWVWRLVVEFRSSEWPIAIDLVLLSLRGVIVSQKYRAVNSWIAGECQVGVPAWGRAVPHPSVLLFASSQSRW